MLTPRKPFGFCQGLSRFAIHVYNACFDGYPSRRMTSAMDCVASYIASAFSFCSLVYIIPSFPPVQDFVRRVGSNILFSTFIQWTLHVPALSTFINSEECLYTGKYLWFQDIVPNEMPDGLPNHIQNQHCWKLYIYYPQNVIQVHRHFFLPHI